MEILVPHQQPGDSWINWLQLNVTWALWCSLDILVSSEPFCSSIRYTGATWSWCYMSTLVPLEHPGATLCCTRRLMEPQGTHVASGCLCGTRVLVLHLSLHVTSGAHVALVCICVVKVTCANKTMREWHNDDQVARAFFDGTSVSRSNQGVQKATRCPGGNRMSRRNQGARVAPAWCNLLPRWRLITLVSSTWGPRIHMSDQEELECPVGSRT